MRKLRVRLADRLIRWAYRLDPSRPSATTSPSGGWLIDFGGMPLAQIKPGHINDQRPVRP